MAVPTSTPVPTGSGRPPGRLPQRWWLRVGFVAAVAVAAVVVALRPTPVPAFRADGEPRPLPPAGALVPASADEFEGILVGLRGQPVIVNVWASWCTPCRSEAPLLARAARAQDVVAIVGVASKDVPAAAQRFVDDYDMRYPNVFDDSGDIRRRLDLRGFPTTYVFNRDGTLVSTLYGGLTERALAAAIDGVR